MDEEQSNPFAETSQEYDDKKEQQLKQQRQKKISAQRKQINEVGDIQFLKVDLYDVISIYFMQNLFEN